MRAAAAVVVVVAVASAAAPARAEDPQARARAHYEIGLGMYQLGNYDGAVREFTAGYALAGRPEFLINLGQAYRKLHELDRAREMFEQYLSRAPADAPDRAQVRALIAEVEAERAAAPPAPPPVVPAPPALLAPPPSVAVAPSPPERHGLRRWWWTIPVGAAVVGAALGVTLYFTLRSSQVSCSSATIACVNLKP